MEMVEIKGDRFTLRPWMESDVVELVEIANNINIAGNMTDTFPHPYTLKDAEGWIKMANEGEKEDKNFAIEFDGQLVGGIGFDINSGVREGSANGGYWIGEEFWGKGIASEAWGMIRDYAFENFDIRRLGAGVFSWNPASAKVQEKCGFEKEGCIRSSVVRLGKVGDEIMYGMTREDWEALKA